MAAGGTANGSARRYSRDDRSYIRWRVELQPQRPGAATVAATGSYDADDAGTGQLFCWNGRQEVLPPWQQNVGTNSHSLQQMRNRLFKKLQPCTGKLQPHARELQAVYTGSTTGGAGRRRGCKHEHSELQPTAMYAGLAMMCASTTGVWDLLRGPASGINGGGVAGREARRR